MPAPTNISPATALDISSLPYTNTQQVTDGGVCYTVWYKFTGILGQLGISIKAANSTGSGTYVPQISIFSPDGVTPYIVEDEPVPIQIGTGVTVDYYIEISPSVEDLSSAILQIDVEGQPAAPIFRRYVLIPDDGQTFFANNFPGVIFDPDTGEVVNMVFPLAEGEYGDILIDGTLCLEDFANGSIKFYDNEFNFITEVDYGVSIGLFIVIRTCVGLQHFYVVYRPAGVGNANIIRSYNASGVEQMNQTMTGVTTNIQSAAASNDGNTLYYSLNSNGAAIKTWNISGGMAGADFATGVGTYRVTDILVLDDDSVLAMYGSTGIIDPCFVRLYDSSGTLVRTYTFTTSLFPNGAFPRIGYGPDNVSTSFGVWWFPEVGISRFQEIQVSDGSVLVSADIPVFEAAVYQGTDPDNVDFGTSNSCPVIILGTNNEFTSGNNTDETLFVSAGPPPDNASGIYEMVPGKTNDTIWTEVGVSSEDVKIP